MEITIAFPHAATMIGDIVRDEVIHISLCSDYVKTQLGITPLRLFELETCRNLI